ncbi:hypothetical protein IE53DRAFT_84818 [Violaceomyces palustris]|uniref:Uncharacterized protein n=1 Tax=Violaceomyces palustris TaxID=1673888 RepID=A0ACD0P762_9BASI|nr:hypothetical protein IE53DRAFT_84818 [Violaceomyces palustris]
MDGWMDGGELTGYMGDTSGAAFYDRLSLILHSRLPKLFFQSPVPLHTHHTWDSKPLPTPREDTTGLPPMHLARHLVSLFFLNCGDFFFWTDSMTFIEDVEARYRDAIHTAVDKNWLGLFNAILAIGALHAGNNSEEEKEAPGSQYMARCKAFLADVCDVGDLVRVQTLALLALFMLSTHRREAAYNYVGLAMRMSLALGLHLNVQGMTSLKDPIQDEETRRRVFWSVYCLDRLISLTLGRPVQLRDSAIATSMPSEVGALPPPAGLRAAVELSRIATKILSDLYSWRSTGASKVSVNAYSIKMACALTDQLDVWDTLLPPEHKMGLRNPRSIFLLKLWRELLVIVVARPTLLHQLATSFTIPHDTRYTLAFCPSDLSDAKMEHLQRKAVIAAKSVCQLLSILLSTNQIVPWSFFDSHVAYNAGMVLLLSSIVAPRGGRFGAADEMSTIYSVLDHMAQHGNESAMSCVSILRSFSKVVDLWDSDSARFSENRFGTEKRTASGGDDGQIRLEDRSHQENQYPAGMAGASFSDGGPARGIGTDLEEEARAAVGLQSFQLALQALDEQAARSFPHSDVLGLSWSGSAMGSLGNGFGGGMTSATADQTGGSINEGVPAASTLATGLPQIPHAVLDLRIEQTYSNLPLFPSSHNHHPFSHQPPPPQHCNTGDGSGLSRAGQ